LKRKRQLSKIIIYNKIIDKNILVLNVDRLDIMQICAHRKKISIINSSKTNNNNLNKNLKRSVNQDKKNLVSNVELLVDIRRILNVNSK
jgi:hypothetical protein